MTDAGSKGECLSQFSSKNGITSEIVACGMCAEYKLQLQEARDELISMQKINELLQNELLTCASPTSTRKIEIPYEHRTTTTKSYSEVAATGGKRNPAVSNFISKKNTTTIPTKVTNLTNMLPNLSSPTPSPNINGNLTDEMYARNKSAWPPSKGFWKTDSNKPNVGNRIPTLINGRVRHNEIMKPAPTPTLKISTRATSNRNNRYAHKVNVIGDSHLKGSAERINQHLNTKYEVCSFIKPGASINQIVHSQEIEFRSLGKKDVIIINGGTNDFGSINTRRNEAAVKITQFLQKYSNTNIILVNIPQRHDLHKESRINLEIQALSTKLGRIASLFDHVTLINADFNRNLFTNHGLHLNKAGKEGLAKLIASNIDKIVNKSNKTKLPILLKGKKEPSNERASISSNCTPEQKPIDEDSSPSPSSPTLTTTATVATPDSTFQLHKNQDNKTDSELTRRSSSRQKKAPVTRCNDFLWQM
jgi:hypothetical protein